MDLQIKAINNRLIQGEIQISGSKSESNRLLILQSLFPTIQIKNLSNSDDTQHMQNALSETGDKINVGHAGTAMRFLTAYFASQTGRTVVLSGSERMHNRPIKILVEALRHLGANIQYLEKEGYPPLKIQGENFTKDTIRIPGNVSSQYISALILVASNFPNGLAIELTGEITSVPYIQMTLSLLEQLGIQTSFTKQTIQVRPAKKLKNELFTVESDWSSASYYYSIMALAQVGSELTLRSYKEESLQGDAVLQKIYRAFGVETKFETDAVVLRKIEEPSSDCIELDLNRAPDIAQTISVTCYGLGWACKLNGLHTLKIKETDRLLALQKELTKLGGFVEITEDSLSLAKGTQIKPHVSIETYDDHRMAMAFAPLGMLVPIQIKDSEVVSKSYPRFWKDLEKIGFELDSQK